jgi:hypothetical protein
MVLGGFGLTYHNRVAPHRVFLGTLSYSQSAITTSFSQSFRQRHL